MKPTLIPLIVFSTALIGCGSSSDHHHDDDGVVVVPTLSNRLIDTAVAGIDTVKMAIAFQELQPLLDSTAYDDPDLFTTSVLKNTTPLLTSTSTTQKTPLKTSSDLSRAQKQLLNRNKKNNNNEKNNNEKTAEKSVTDFITTEHFGACGGDAIVDELYTSDDVNQYPVAIDIDADFDDFCQYLDSNQVVMDGQYDIKLDAFEPNTEFVETELALHYEMEPFFAPAFGFIDQVSDCTYGYGIDSYTSCVDTYFTSVRSRNFDFEVVRTELTPATARSTIGLLTSPRGEILDVNFRNLEFCTNGNIGHGNGDITYEDGTTIFIDFEGCSRFFVTYDGITEELLF
ncbi:hypothetical protein [Marinibactrum halimedae]|uniref:Lipoprotein n=1 Tax=Marinibactrum halimedae TaxID=1444977 RepID=A0AA37WPB2_9GAMM|nr:hypothetical protein [Marinibactrum halimedae]MCD9459998.1 hypothetical protein [Marinibactrum halimedae]GLS28233.1 hypothetical protein GCM10007877_39520 [Marinibactrum halimedae]